MALTVVASNAAPFARASGHGTYVTRGADGRVSGRLTRRSGSHAESTFVIELVAPELAIGALLPDGRR